MIALVAMALLAAAGPAFDVATMKRSRPVGVGENYTANLGTARNGAVELTNATLADCIKFAYGLVSDDQVDGPVWAKSKEVRYDVVGKAPAATSRDDLLLMLRTLLAERMHLAMHTEPRRMTHYALTVARGGPKLHESTVEPAAARTTLYRTGALAHNRITMLTLSMLLSRQLRELVLDETGLKGVYDLKLEWTPQAPGSADAPDSGASIFTAVQEQLGLKLEARKDAVNVLVIDRAGRVPADN